MRVAEDPASPAGRDSASDLSMSWSTSFADTNITQYRLVRALSARSSQNFVRRRRRRSTDLHRWRGADVRIIRGFRRLPNAVAVKLEQNYRSSANIVKAALGVTSGSAARAQAV